MSNVAPATAVSGDRRAAMPGRTREQNHRRTFWIDDRIVDDFAPVMGRYTFGAAALAVYAVLARRADREGHSWPSLALIAAEAGSCPRTVHKALRLLELLGLIEIAACYETVSQRQTSNLYTLLTPPESPPSIDPDPDAWPSAQRRTLLIPGGNRSEAVAAARLRQRPNGAASPPVATMGIPCTTCTPAPAPLSPSPRTTDHPPPAPRAPQEGNTNEKNTVKDGYPHFVIDEIGLSNRQVWAATLDELARRGQVSRAELETWLRPAEIVGQEGDRLIVGTPNAVARDRIERRLLPALREAMAATLGRPAVIEVVIRPLS